MNSYMIVIEGATGYRPNEENEVTVDLQIIVIAKNEAQAEDLAESIIYSSNFLGFSSWYYNEIFIKNVSKVSDNAIVGVNYYIEVNEVF